MLPEARISLARRVKAVENVIFQRSGWIYTLEMTSVEQDSVQPKDSDTLLLFVKQVKLMLSPEELREGVRATPAGLFVEKSLQSKLVECYQNWLQEKTRGTVAKSERKCSKRLFGAENPPEYYLIEGKKCLLGLLVVCPLQQPQSLSLPFYLGSLAETRAYLHPGDPGLEAMQARLVPASGGHQLEVRVRERKYLLSPSFLLDFQRLASQSTVLSKRFPGLTEALRESARAAVELLRKAKIIGKKESLFVPSRYGKVQGASFMRVGSLVFVGIGENLQFCYELRGRNLRELVRAEVGRGSKHGRNPGQRSSGSGKQHRIVATLHINRRAFGIASSALQEFVEQTIQSGEIRGHPRYTVWDCLAELKSICERSDEIAGEMIRRHIEGIKVNRAAYRTLERWILVVDQSGTVVRCLEKGQKPSGSFSGRGNEKSRRFGRDRSRE